MKPNPEQLTAVLLHVSKLRRLDRDNRGFVENALIMLADELQRAQQERDDAKLAASFWKTGARAVRQESRLSIASNVEISLQRLSDLKALQLRVHQIADALTMLKQAASQPIGIDISNFGEEWCSTSDCGTRTHSFGSATSTERHCRHYGDEDA